MSRRNRNQVFSDAHIKLFGQRIHVSSSSSPPSAATDSPASSAGTAEGYAETERKKELGKGIAGESHKEDGKPLQKLKARGDVKGKGVKIHEQKAEKSDTDSDEKALKKPDKIIPCPRCRSMDTKFCYFNNYNVNQPRHFCKSCLRYWTDGGTIRNVPIGAGRRKNKQIAPQFQPVASSSYGEPVTQVNVLNSADPSGVSSAELISHTELPMETREICQNGNDPPLCKSVADSLSLGDQKKAMDNPGNPCKEVIVPPSSSSSSAPKEVVQIGPSSPQISPETNFQCYSNLPSYARNNGWTTKMTYNADRGNPLAQWQSFPPMVTAPRFCGATSGFTPLVPTPYWNWHSSPWNMQTNNLSPSSSVGNNSSSGITSPLGKHPRDLTSLAEEATEKHLWVPKTLRIGDPDEAAKSSIWTTLGIKPGDREPFSKAQPLKGIVIKSEVDAQQSNGDPSLQANPAALSRFKAFQESA